MQGIKEYIVGKKFGSYTVISEDYKRNKKERQRKENGEIKYNSIYYIVQCECGKEKSIKKSCLLNGEVSSCGCKTKTNKKHLKSILNKRFGKLVVINESDDFLTCKCKCDCGNEVEVERKRLIGGLKSCGCSKKDYNKSCNFEFDYNKKLCYIITPRKNHIATIDIEDYNKIKYLNWKSYGKYIRCDEDFLHNVIMDFIPQKNIGYEVDHINRNTLDNRKENLRIITHKENARNTSIGKNNKSGFIGVSFDKSKNLWRAMIKVDGKQISLKSSKNINECIKARLQAELKYFGKDFAPQRHLFNEYDIK